MSAYQRHVKLSFVICASKQERQLGYHWTAKCPHNLYVLRTMQDRVVYIHGHPSHWHLCSEPSTALTIRCDHGMLINEEVWSMKRSLVDVVLRYHLDYSKSIKINNMQTFKNKGYNTVNWAEVEVQWTDIVIRRTSL